MVSESDDSFIFVKVVEIIFEIKFVWIFDHDRSAKAITILSREMTMVPYVNVRMYLKNSQGSLTESA